ncbi:MAG: HDIG domain-containing protein [Alicyclobacillaceae bacterium]|jgi:putative nucleotidyltransferase with HDIG domain|uniref:HD domain-containing protein n=1 Tax=Alicyclobacillus sp. SP_1 TaxID=2942475 RepID=UPI002156FEC3|nr:HD domain-containing protein [Alicyclobacillus sp. SP_1]MCY0887789.1 HDIG domain-containing protein [Alicyclobacillaceae bacterium]MCY0896068.1 HDIG domain-containing protein [Alicyclobacillaceae bacterium]
MTEQKTRQEALSLLHEYTQSESLLRHAYAVEAVCRAYARQFGESEEWYGLAGLLHDFDYERYPTPEEHTVVGARILEEHGYPPEVIYAIRAHADYNHLERNTLLAKVLFAADEVSGFVMAVTMVRPTRNLAELETKSVLKKLKDKAFARGVHREDVYQGAAELNIPLEQHIDFVIEALRPIAKELGLDGSAAE